MKKEEGIRQFLIKHADEEPVSFHMPGHKGSAIYRKYGYGEFLDKIMDCDITEIPGADNLFQYEDIILETMKKYKKLYEVRKSYLLVNGSSSGLIASILASVEKGGKLLMARNCHKSIFNALPLGSIDPVYMYPDTIEEYGILGAVSPETVAAHLEEDPEIQAVILPSPNYYGICSDIKAISDICHAHGKILIVDQAHGAHLKFMHRFGGELGQDYPDCAEDSGADLVINSVHKTLASWTQSAVLNVCSDKVNLQVLDDKLQQIESSSPSYPMMATLDINADMLKNHGKELMQEWAENIEYFYSNAFNIPGLVVLTPEGLDGTKINLDMSAYGLNGDQLEKLLNKEHIYPELITGNIVMLMTGIGNTREHYDRLLKVLLNIALTTPRAAEKPKQPESLTKVLERKAVPVHRESVKLDDACGRVCASSIIPYPPGIPIACPGEVLDEEVIMYISARREANEKVIGVDKDGKVLVGVE